MSCSAESLISTSVDDCALTINRAVESNPAEGLMLATETLQLLNAQGLNHKSRRAALVKAGKKAITALGDGHEKQAD